MDQNKSKIPPTTIIKRLVENWNSDVSEKYKLTPNEIEKRSLESEFFKTEFNFECIKISKKVSNRLDRYCKKIPPPPPKKKEKKNVREKLDIGETVLALPERIRKKSAPVKFYKQNVQIFLILTKKKYLS